MFLSLSHDISEQNTGGILSFVISFFFSVYSFTLSNTLFFFGICVCVSIVASFLSIFFGRIHFKLIMDETELPKNENKVAEEQTNDNAEQIN